MIIGITGRAGSGKDTVAGFMKDHDPSAVRLSFAEPLKTFCKEVFDWTDAHVNGDLKDVEDQRYPRAKGAKGPSFLTPRYALQTLGTEWGRDCFHSTWIGVLMRRAKALEGLGRVVIVTDVRFLNEAQAVTDGGGFVVKVLRTEGLRTDASHSSEREQSHIAPDDVICNTSGLDHLRAQSIDSYRRALKGAAA